MMVIISSWYNKMPAVQYINASSAIHLKWDFSRGGERRDYYYFQLVVPLLQSVDTTMTVLWFRLNGTKFYCTLFFGCWVPYSFELVYWGTRHRSQHWGLIVEWRNLITGAKTSLVIGGTQIQVFANHRRLRVISNQELSPQIYKYTNANRLYSVCVSEYSGCNNFALIIVFASNTLSPVLPRSRWSNGLACLQQRPYCYLQHTQLGVARNNYY